MAVGGEMIVGFLLSILASIGSMYLYIQKREDIMRTERVSVVKDVYEHIDKVRFEMAQELESTVDKLDEMEKSVQGIRNNYTSKLDAIKSDISDFKITTISAFGEIKVLIQKALDNKAA